MNFAESTVPPLREDDPGLVEQHAAPRDAVALEPGALVSPGLEPELPELVRHILSGHIEPPARRVPAQHGVIGNNADAAGNILRRDRGGRPVDGALVWATPAGAPERTSRTVRVERRMHWFRDWESRAVEGVDGLWWIIVSLMSIC